MVVWLTGLSGSGKTTIARGVRSAMQVEARPCEVLDGDEVRHSLCRDLGFSRQDREENVRRIGWIAALLERHGVTVIVAAIAPYRAQRDHLRTSFKEMLEVYVDAPVSVCEQRDTKQLYARARRGEVTNLTGIDQLYEAPLNPDVHCRTDREEVNDSVERVLRHLGL